MKHKKLRTLQNVINSKTNTIQKVHFLKQQITIKRTENNFIEKETVDIK